MVEDDISLCGVGVMGSESPGLFIPGTLGLMQIPLTCSKFRTFDGPQNANMNPCVGD
jgi:hypothetical protein